MALNIEQMRVLGLTDQQIMGVFQQAQEQAAAPGGTSSMDMQFQPSIVDPTGRVIVPTPVAQAPAPLQPPSIVMPPAPVQPVDNSATQVLATLLEKLVPAQPRIPAVPVVPATTVAAAAPGVVDAPVLPEGADLVAAKPQKYTGTLKDVTDKLETLTGMFTNMQEQRVADRAATDLAAYKATLIAKAGDAIIPEMVVGATIEDLNASFILAQQKWHTLVAETTKTAAGMLETAQPAADVIPAVQTAAAIAAGTPIAVQTGATPVAMPVTPQTIGQVAEDARNSGTYDAVRSTLMQAGKALADGVQRPAGNRSIVTTPVPATPAAIVPAATVPADNSTPLNALTETQLFQRHAASMNKRGKVSPDRVLSLDPNQHPQLGADNVSHLMGSVATQVASPVGQVVNA